MCPPERAKSDDVAAAASTDATADDIVFRPAWGNDDPQVRQSAEKFWLGEGGTRPFVKRRITELCAVAFSGDEPVAVSTANLSYSATLRNKFFFYRCMIGSRFRQRNLAWRITAYSMKVVHEWAAKHAADQRIMGLMAVFEADEFITGARWPVREKFGVALHFVGYTPEGEQIRVAWFDGAMLDDKAARKVNPMTPPAAT